MAMHRKSAHGKRGGSYRADAIFYVMIGIGVSGGLAYVPLLFTILEDVLNYIDHYTHAMLAVVVFGSVWTALYPLFRRLSPWIERMIQEMLYKRRQ